MVLLSVPKKQDGRELFDVLIDIYADFPLKAIKHCFKRLLITLNGEDSYGDDIVHEGDEVRIFAPPDVVGIDLEPKIVYQDENIIIADKPAGLPSASQKDEPSVIQFIEKHMKKRGEYHIEALMLPYLVYSLDDYVSGLLLIAKHEEAYLFFIEALAQRRISRYYICPVKGQAKEQDELLGYHLRDKAGKRVMISDGFKKGYKPIVTRYKKTCPKR